MAVTAKPDDQEDPLLLPGEVAALFRVDPKTVTRWANAGRLTAVRTPGGHVRFRESVVLAHLNGGTAKCPACRHFYVHDAFGCTEPDCNCKRTSDAS